MAPIDKRVITGGPDQDLRSIAETVHVLKRRDSRRCRWPLKVGFSPEEAFASPAANVGSQSETVARAAMSVKQRLLSVATHS